MTVWFVLAGLSIEIASAGLPGWAPWCLRLIALVLMALFVYLVVNRAADLLESDD